MRTSPIILKYSLFILLLALTLHAAAGQQPVSLMEQIMKERPILAELLTKAGYAPLLSCDNTYTILAPPESALRALQTASAAEVRATLAAHILKGNYLQSDLKEGSSIPTLAGSKLSIFRKKDQTLVNGVRILQADSKAKNGVIHGLDNVLAI